MIAVSLEHISETMFSRFSLLCSDTSPPLIDNSCRQVYMKTPHLSTTRLEVKILQPVQSGPSLLCLSPLVTRLLSLVTRHLLLCLQPQSSNLSPTTSSLTPCPFVFAAHFPMLKVSLTNVTLTLEGRKSVALPLFSCLISSPASLDSFNKLTS